MKKNSLKKTGGGRIPYRETKIRITSDFSVGTMQATREWSEIFKVLREKKITNLEF